MGSPCSPSKENTPKLKFQAVRMCEMDFSMFGIHSSTKKNSARKNYAIPVRPCDMNFKFFDDEASKKKPVRKQLWSNKKDSKKRLSTSMKPNRNTLRMTTYNKQPSAAKNLSTRQTESSSKLYTFKKPILQSEKKAKKKLNMDLEGSGSKLKMPQESKVTVPKIVVSKPVSSNRNTTESETINKRQSTNNNIADLLIKKESSDQNIVNLFNKGFDELMKESSNQNVVDLCNKRIDEIILKESSNQHIVNLFNKRFDEFIMKESSNQNIVDLFNKRFDELNIKVEAISKRLDKFELSNKYICKECGYTSLNEEKIIDLTEKEECKKSQIEEKLNSSCFIVETQETIDCSPKPNINQNTTLEINNLIDNALSDIKSLPNKNDEDVKKVSVNPVKKNKSSFEMLEWKLLNGSPMSSEFSISDPESPLIQINDINSLINDKDDFKSPLCKSLSTSSIVKHISKPGDTTSKSYNDLDSVYKYNEMRKNISFLCTPKNTSKVSHLETPSVRNNHKKLISRRVQQQLLMLD